MKGGELVVGGFAFKMVQASVAKYALEISRGCVSEHKRPAYVML
jgi:hypothetical protein